MSMPEYLDDNKSYIQQVLDLEKIDENIYRGFSPNTKWNKRVYGGQLVGQSLNAASQTVPQDFRVHSLHSYFLNPGDIYVPIVYNVERTRDASSFATRRVQAIQNGKFIFSLICSFQRYDPEAIKNALRHQTPLPDNIVPPEEVPSDQERLSKIVNNPKYPRAIRNAAELVLQTPLAMDMKQHDPVNHFKPEIKSPWCQIYVRASGELPEDPKFHQCVSAYASDAAFVTTMLRPHGLNLVSARSRGITLASIDYSMWFHEEYRADDWLLMVCESHKTSESRGLALCRMYDSSGRLVVSASQECLIRRKQSSSL